SSGVPISVERPVASKFRAVNANPRAVLVHCYAEWIHAVPGRIPIGRFTSQHDVIIYEVTVPIIEPSNLQSAPGVAKIGPELPSTADFRLELRISYAKIGARNPITPI